MSNPYTESWLPVALAADALRNQADTIADELNASIDRTKAFRAKMKAREAEKSAMCDCGHAAGQVCFCGQASPKTIRLSVEEANSWAEFFFGALAPDVVMREGVAPPRLPSTFPKAIWRTVSTGWDVT